MKRMMLALTATATFVVSATANEPEYPACNPAPEYSETAVIEYLQQRTGVVRSIHERLRREACQDAQSEAFSAAYRSCREWQAFATSDCFDCSRNRAADDQWRCRMEWECIGSYRSGGNPIHATGIYRSPYGTSATRVAACDATREGARRYGGRNYGYRRCPRGRRMQVAADCRDCFMDDDGRWSCAREWACL